MLILLSLTLLLGLIWGSPLFGAKAPEVMGFVGDLVVFFLLMMWVQLGSVVVVFGCLGGDCSSRSSVT